MASSKSKNKKTKAQAPKAAEKPQQEEAQKKPQQEEVQKKPQQEEAQKKPQKAQKDASNDKAKSKQKDNRLNKNGKPKLWVRIKEYFNGVRTEIKRVVWPKKEELIKYTIAVVGMLIFFGVLIALVDAAIVPLLYAFSGLRG